MWSGPLNPALPSSVTQSNSVGRGAHRAPPSPSGPASLQAKHSPPTTGRSTGSAAASSRSTVSGANPMSESTHHSQSESFSARNPPAASLRPSTIPPVAAFMLIHPPRTTCWPWVRS